MVLIPVTINYDKIYEGQMFPYELIGDESKRESIGLIFKHMLWVNERFGRVYVKYCKPIFLKDKVQDFVDEQKIDKSILFSRMNFG